MQEAESSIDRKQRPENAIQYLENRASFAALRAQGEERFLTAFQPLYNNLSSKQKKSADEIFDTQHIRVMFVNAHLKLLIKIT